MRSISMALNLLVFLHPSSLEDRQSSLIIHEMLPKP